MVANKFRKRLDDPLVGWALLTMFVVCVFFFGLMLGPGQPVPGHVAAAPASTGPGPNPLLQNHILMAFHPPMLYLGYVGFTVPFAFAIAALVTGRVGEGWLVETRRWTLFAWGFLTVGIVLGRLVELRGARLGRLLGVGPGRERLAAAVAHRHRLPALGDGPGAPRHAARLEPVAAVRHVLAHHPRHVPHPLRRGRVGARLLASPPSARCCSAFFAVDRGRLGRADRLAGRPAALAGRIDSPLSREGAFLANNVVFAAFAFVVLLGTVFPLIIEALNGDTLSVGAPYFNRMTMPIGLTLLLLMAIAPVLPWRKASGELLRDRLLVAGLDAASARSSLAVVIGGTRGGAAARVRPRRLRRRLGPAPDRPRHPPPGLAGPRRSGQRRHGRAPRGGHDGDRGWPLGGRSHTREGEFRLEPGRVGACRRS